jgi:hypothetical protein
MPRQRMYEMRMLDPRESVLRSLCGIPTHDGVIDQNQPIIEVVIMA